METVEEFRKALVGCKKRSDGTRAIELLREMEGRGLGPGAREYTACIVACSTRSHTGARPPSASLQAHQLASVQRAPVSANSYVVPRVCQLPPLGVEIAIAPELVRHLGRRGKVSKISVTALKIY